MSSINLNIFKVSDEFEYEELKTLLKDKLKIGIQEVVINEKIETKDSKTYKFCGIYVREEFSGNDTLWERKFYDIFELSTDVIKKVYSSYGIIIISIDEIIYIISFGRANGKLTDIIDVDFGLDMAAKMLSEETIKVQSSKFFALNKNKSIVEFSKTRFMGTVGESFDALVGEVEEYTGRHAIEQITEFIRKKARFTTSISLNIEEDCFDLEHLSSLIFNLETIRNGYPERFPIPKLKRVKEREIDLLNRLNNKLNEKILAREFNDGKIIISFYRIEDSKFVFAQDVESYKLFKDRKNIGEFPELTIEDIVVCMEENEINDINKINVQVVYTDGSKSGTPIPVINLLEYTVNLEGDEDYYTLSYGVWHRYNEKYLEIIDKSIERLKDIVDFEQQEYDYNKNEVDEFAVAHKEELDEIISKNPYTEIKYNFMLSKKLDADLCDRRNVHGIEVCDIYMNMNGLVHVKFGAPTNFIECIDQSKKGIEMYKNNTTAVKTLLGIGDTQNATLVFITNNQSVIRNKDISKFNSLRFKINILEWYNFVISNQFIPKIIIGKEI